MYRKYLKVKKDKSEIILTETEIFKLLIQIINNQINNVSRKKITLF